MDFKDSQTYKNLNSAFAGELQASSKYRLYAENADDEKKIHIARALERISVNELAHAEVWYKLMNSGKAIPLVSQLKTAAAAEKHEWCEMYKQFARTARREGYEQIARLFEGVGAIEYRHNKEISAFIQSIEQNRGLCRADEAVWVCTNCGSLYKGTCAPTKCPVCGHPQGYFELFCGN